MKVYDGAQWIEASAQQQAALVTYEYVATAGQTTFSGADANSLTLSYIAGGLIVSLNGVILRPGDDYTATNGTSIVLASGAAAGDELCAYAFNSFDIANTYTQAQTDTLLAAKLNANNPSYTGTLTGGTGVINIGSGQLYKDATGNVGIGTSSPANSAGQTNLEVVGSTARGNLTLRTAQADGAGVAVGAVAFNGGASTSGGGDVRTALILSSTEGATANNRGGILSFNTKSNNGDLSERMRITSAGNVGIGTTAPNTRFHVNQSADGSGISLGASFRGASTVEFEMSGVTNQQCSFLHNNGSNKQVMLTMGRETLEFLTNNTERMRITSSGELLVGKTASDVGTVGARITSSGTLVASTSSEVGLFVNRNTTDGVLVAFRQDNIDEGNISVSGTTVSYNGGHLSRWAQTTTAKDESLVKGTVLSNLDEMNVYTDADGNPVENEQLNKVKVSDVEGDPDVAGVFVNWTHDDAHEVDEINMAMTGDMIIRIAEGVTVQRGDLLMSAGDGTAKPQGDDIVRSKTIAKVTSTHVTCTYADGSFCVPCVLMAC
jgi:hypothetical protein